MQSTLCKTFQKEVKSNFEGSVNQTLSLEFVSVVNHTNANLEMSLLFLSDPAVSFTAFHFYVGSSYCLFFF